MPESDVVIASARLNARKSVSASGRRIRNGSTTSRVIACARAVVDPVSRPAAARSSSAITSAEGRPIRRPLGQRAPDHAIDRGDGRRAAERRRLLGRGGTQHLHDRASCESRPPSQHLEQDGARREEIGCARRQAPRSRAPAPCSGACRPAIPDCVIAVIVVAAGSSRSGRASPKSSSLTPWAVTNTFDGLRSRWMIPRAWSADSADSMPEPDRRRDGTHSSDLAAPRRPATRLRAAPSR